MVKDSLASLNNCILVRVILNAAQLLNAMVSYVVGKAAAPLLRVYFGTGQVVGSESLYSMAQCNPNMSPQEWHSWMMKLKLKLLVVVVKVNGGLCFLSRMGGRLLEVRPQVRDS